MNPKRASTTQMPIVGWSDINQQGTYVEVETGELYRFPEEALVAGHSPLISTSKRTGFARLSEDPNLIISQARRLCADADIKPDF